MRTGRSRSRVAVARCSSSQSAAGPGRCRPARPAATWTSAHGAVGRREHLVLHLHRLDDDERLAGRHGVAGGDEHAQHGARHRRDERPGGERRRPGRGGGGARVNVTWPSSASTKRWSPSRPTRNVRRSPRVVEHDGVGRRRDDGPAAERGAVDGDVAVAAEAVGRRGPAARRGRARGPGRRRGCCASPTGCRRARRRPARLAACSASAAAAAASAHVATDRVGARELVEEPGVQVAGDERRVRGRRAAGRGW